MHFDACCLAFLCSSSAYKIQSCYHCLQSVSLKLKLFLAKCIWTLVLRYLAPHLEHILTNGRRIIFTMIMLVEKVKINICPLNSHCWNKRILIVYSFLNIFIRNLFYACNLFKLSLTREKRWFKRSQYVQRVNQHFQVYDYLRTKLIMITIQILVSTHYCSQV